jgi:hypothetical protein
MPRDPVEILMESAVEALKLGGKPYHSQAQQAHELLALAIRIARGKKVDQIERLEVSCRDIAGQLDRSHPLADGYWLNWATRVASCSEGSVNRGHVLRRLADLRDTP